MIFIPIHILELSGFFCAFHPVALGSNPKHTVCGFFIMILLILLFALEYQKIENQPDRAETNIF